MTDGTTPDQPTPEQPPPGWVPPPAAPSYGWPAPPGQVPPGQVPPPPAYGQYQYGQPGQPVPVPYAPPGYLPLHQARPVYKPGTIPLKPLGVGDMFSGAIETIRRNPKATLGVAAVVLTVLMLVPSLAVLAWGQIAGFGSQVATSTDPASFDPQTVGLLFTLVGSGLLSGLATVVLTGMIVHVVEHAARGQKLSAGAAWRLTRSRVWRLIGLALVGGLVPLVVWVPVGLIVAAAFLASTTAGWITVVVGVMAGIPLMVFLYVRLVPLAAAILVLEQRGVFSSMSRSWDLTSRQFWRTFGIVLLTLLVTSIAGQFVSFPFGILGVIAGSIWPDTLVGILVGLLAQNVAVVIAGTITTPFSAAVVALQYLDQRIRKEGYDIELISRVSAAAAAPGPAAYGKP